MVRRAAVVASVLGMLGLVVLAGCGDDAADVADVADVANGAVAGAPNGVVVDVQALDNSFRPESLTIEVGTEVVFTNVGRNDHNVLPEPDSIQGWGVGEAEFGPKAEYRHVFDAPGEYAYVCTIHGVNGKGMVGTVTVTAVGAD
jgi:plastocyanin